MDLSEKQKKYLRGLGHRLKPTILIGAGGLKNSVIKEFESTIDRHELVKVRTRVGNREKRNIRRRPQKYKEVQPRRTNRGK